ncbi:MAG: hypothetical protein J0H49_15400 [Acidobacteria bacterium]|nr:hypothetical protein [Acidobacteriota bacterium]
MSRSAIRLSLALAAVASMLANAQQERTPKAAAKVIQDALQALGGDRFLAMQDRVEEGRFYAFYRENLSGMSRAKVYTRYLLAPEPMKPNFFGIRERRAFGKKNEDYFVVYNELGGYEITYKGAKTLDKVVFDTYQETLFHNVLYTLRMRLKEPGLTFDPAGVDIVENQPCNVVDIVDSDNRVTKVWFHQSTKLPVKQYWDRRDPKTRDRIEEVTIFDKYRDIGGGVMWPYVIRRERNGERNFEMYADSITINQGLTDELFTLSSDVKIIENKGSNIRPGKK